MSSEGNTGFQIAFWGLLAFVIGLFFSLVLIAQEGLKYAIEDIIEFPLLLGCLVLGIIAFILGGSVYLGELRRIQKIQNDPIRSREYNKRLQQEREAAEKARELRMKQRAAELEAERQAAIYSQTNGAPWERFYTFPCPGAVTIRLDRLLGMIKKCL